MPKTPSSRKEPTPRDLRRRSLLAYALCAALLYFCLIDGSQGDTVGAIFNGVAAILNLWMAMKCWTWARQREQDAADDSPP